MAASVLDASTEQTLFSTDQPSVGANHLTCQADSNLPSPPSRDTVEDSASSVLGSSFTSCQMSSISPPSFEPPPLPRSIAVPLTSKPLSGLQIQPPQMLPQLTPHGVTSFPSPYSAFTELQPKGSRGSANSLKSPILPRSNTTVSTPSSCVHQSPMSARSVRGMSLQDSPKSSSLAPCFRSSGVVYCSICGQSHDLSSPHRYHYTQSVDADLCCMLCHQPLVAPLDTKCGHTFCAPCLKNHLTVQALCPVDQQIINYLECQQASNIVKRLLDKLLIACPNVQFCNTILQRCELEEHLRDWCAGTIVPCDNASRGCMFAGPRVLYLQHRCKCPCLGFVPVNSTLIQRSAGNLSDRGAREEIINEQSVRLPCVHSSPNQSRLAPKTDLRSPLSDIDETYDSPTIPAGVPVSVVIRRTELNLGWGFTFVGGTDTPLACILIQEIYLDGAVARDGRLRPGDQILEVDGRPLVMATHAEARQQLTTQAMSIQLVIFRESFSWDSNRSSASQSEEERFSVKLCKQRSKVLGIKLVGKRHLPGLYVLELVSGCEAQLDGRLRKDDRILEINGIDLTEGTQEQAAAIINSAKDFVEFKVSRRLRADTPDIVRITSHSSESASLSRAIQSLRSNKVKSITRNASLTRCRLEQPILRKCESDDPVRRDSSRLPSPTTLASSRLTETSSLNAFRASSSETDVASDAVSQPTSEAERKAQEQFISGFTSASDSPELKPSEVHELDPKPVCQERIVAIDKPSDEPLGITVAGGRNSQRGDTPVYVTNIREQSVFGQSKLIKRGDVLLEVNGTGLVGLTHHEAVNVLRCVSSSCTRVQIRLIDAPETCDGPENFLPSWTFWIQLPAVCQLTRVIQLRRSRGGKEPLGFSILGGTEPNSKPTKTTKSGFTSIYPSPIVVKSIVPGHLAHRDGRLKCGDLILAVNSISMLDISHAIAVRVLKNLNSDIELRIISWPGTIV